MKYNPRTMSLLGQSASIFGIALLEQMKQRDDLIVISADMSTTAGLDKFKALYPDHFVNAGIAEQNMIGMATGLTDEGYRVICVTQACFISMRDFEAVRQYAGYMGAKLIIIGIGSGYSLSFLGNTHYALEDVALMREIPGMTVIAPADAQEAVDAFDAALNLNGPVYIRLFGGTGIPIVYGADCDFALNRAHRLKEGSQIQIVAMGSMVYFAIKVGELLGDAGISAAVVDMHTIKPLDTDVLDMNVKMIVSVEEHFKTGGLGSAIGDFLAGMSAHPKLLKFGADDKFSDVGDYPYLLDQNGLSEEKIYNTVKRCLNEIERNNR
ncbi:MAG: transketolase C-terminal domain-containing protein [Prevotella sp.]